MAMQRLEETPYNINDRNLAIRREFIRLGEEERTLLESFIPWAEKYADQIAREFYDWQFSFPATASFFDQHAAERGIPLARLRQHLEQSQSAYYKEIFYGARSSWGVEYFTRRVSVGRIHDRINLPFKWYIGSYAEFQRLTRRYLLETQDDHRLALRVYDAVSLVMNYDMQAVGDSFLLSTLESMGLDVNAVQTTSTTDTTEHLAELKEMIATLLAQAQAIAAYQVRNPLLDKVVPGELGGAFGAMIQNIRNFVDLTLENANALNLVAASSEQMSASIREIASNSSQAATIATSAVHASEEASTTISRLGESSTQIGDVLKVIRSIAEQTNLLALNATIEAARAGDAGRGFAVVANEVKELAKETAAATGKIKARVDAIQADVSQAVDAVGKIATTIHRINDFSRTIAAAVEEQTITTNEIASSVARAAQGTAEIAQAVSGEGAEYVTDHSAQSSAPERKGVEGQGYPVQRIGSRVL